jgi:hypothetical protein
MNLKIVRRVLRLKELVTLTKRLAKSLVYIVMIRYHGHGRRTACGVERSTGPNTTACSLRSRSDQGEQRLLRSRSE